MAGAYSGCRGRDQRQPSHHIFSKVRKAFHDCRCALSTLQQHGAGRLASVIGHRLVGSRFAHHLFADHRSAGAGSADAASTWCSFSPTGAATRVDSVLSVVSCCFLPTTGWCSPAGCIIWPSIFLSVAGRYAMQGAIACPFVLVVPCLVLTFLFGPIGLLALSASGGRRIAW